MLSARLFPQIVMYVLSASFKSTKQFDYFIGFIVTTLKFMELRLLQNSYLMILLTLSENSSMIPEKLLARLVLDFQIPQTNYL